MTPAWKSRFSRPSERSKKIHAYMRTRKLVQNGRITSTSSKRCRGPRRTYRTSQYVNGNAMPIVSAVAVIATHTVAHIVET